MAPRHLIVFSAGAMCGWAMSMAAAPLPIPAPKRPEACVVTHQAAFIAPIKPKACLEPPPAAPAPVCPQAAPRVDAEPAAEPQKDAPRERRRHRRYRYRRYWR